MKQFTKRIFALLLALVMVLPMALSVCASEADYETTILFTHDLHDHFLPATKEGGGEYGGYARLMTRIREQKEKYPNALLLDGGDFSMGSLFQTAYTSSALELRMMGAMGYDVTTFGNHEFDYLPKGLAAMLNAAADSGETVPAIVDANYLPHREGEEGYGENAQIVWDALDNYGVKDYVILQPEENVYVAVFGLTGYDSDDCAPNSGMVLETPAEAAQRTVDAARAECLETYGCEPLVVALSHSGTSDGKGEDYELAQKVTGIHLIISAHSHTTLEQPILVGNTWIVSSGEYGKNLGVVKLRKSGDTVTVPEYQLIPIGETVPEDPEISALVESYKGEVEENYLSKYGMTFDQVLTNNPYEFDNVRAVYNYQHESTLGNVFSDAYKWAVEQATGKTVDLALTASGVIRESIPLGDVTVSDIFNAASLGVGTEGELVAIYLTGKDLKTALEVDASVYPLMHAAQLFCSGVEYSYNTNRMIFNKVDYAMLRTDSGLEAIDDEKLYYVTCGMYMGQMLGSVEKTSMGLISITPRTESGEPIAMDELVNYVVRDENGNNLKEWYAIASYLQQMGGTMDPQYAETDGRKVVYSSWNPVKLLQSANKFTYILLAVIVILVAAVILIARAVAHAVRKKKAKRG